MQLEKRNKIFTIAISKEMTILPLFFGIIISCIFGIIFTISVSYLLIIFTIAWLIVYSILLVETMRNINDIYKEDYYKTRHLEIITKKEINMKLLFDSIKLDDIELAGNKIILKSTFRTLNANKRLDRKYPKMIIEQESRGCIKIYSDDKYFNFFSFYLIAYLHSKIKIFLD